MFQPSTVAQDGAKVEMAPLEPLQLLPDVQIIQVSHVPMEARGTKTEDGTPRGLFYTVNSVSYRYFFFFNWDFMCVVYYFNIFQ